MLVQSKMKSQWFIGYLANIQRPFTPFYCTTQNNIWNKPLFEMNVSSDSMHCICSMSFAFNEIPFLSHKQINIAAFQFNESQINQSNQSKWMRALGIISFYICVTLFLYSADWTEKSPIKIDATKSCFGHFRPG